MSDMGDERTRKIYEIDEIRERLRPVFEAAPVYRAILFGSYAKGLADEISDVDIVIDSRGELRGLKFVGVMGDVIDALEKDVDMFEIKEILRDSPIWNTIMTEGVTLYDR